MRAADRRLFQSLKQEVTNLHMFWKVYRQLFAKNRQRIELLNEMGSLVFYILQHLLLDEVTLSLSRLTDPAKTRRKSNRSIERLISRIDVRRHPDLKRELTQLIEDLKIKCSVFRERRNKAVAHSDLATVLKLRRNPLLGISRAKVEEALSTLRKLMNKYEYYFQSSSTIYEEVILPLGADGDFLVLQLKRAYAYRELERSGEVDKNVWKSGRYKDA